MSESDVEIELSYLRKKLKREKIARMQAEVLLENKSSELFDINKRLQETNKQLDKIVAKRTRALRASAQRVETTSGKLETIVNRLNLVLDIANAVTWLLDIRQGTIDLAGKCESLLGIEPVKGMSIEI